MTSGDCAGTIPTPATVPPRTSRARYRSSLSAPEETAITRAAPLLLLLAILAMACTTSRAIEPSPTATRTPTALPTANAVWPTATATAEPTLEPPVAVAPEIVPQAEALVPPVAVAPAQEPVVVAPTAVPGGTALTLPEGTSVVWGGCASDGTCYWYNFYWAPTHEVVMQDGEGQHKVQHELCHAHQHWTISGGAPLDPSDYDLESWLSTAEGTSFAAAVAGLSWPWSHSAVSVLEDFAWTCAYWYLDPAHLLASSPERYDWAAANLP